MRASLSDLRKSADQAQQAYDRRDITIGAYTDAQTAALGKQIEAATLSESLDEQRIALRALLGDALPTSQTPNLQFTRALND